MIAARKADSTETDLYTASKHNKPEPSPLPQASPPRLALMSSTMTQTLPTQDIPGDNQTTQQEHSPLNQSLPAYPPTPSRQQTSQEPMDEDRPILDTVSMEPATAPECEAHDAETQSPQSGQQTDPGTEFPPLHPLELRERIMELGCFLPQVTGPIRSAVQSSPLAPWLPANWFNVTTAPLSAGTDREFTPKFLRYDPDLLRCFLEADINMLCLDRAITVRDIGNFSSRKYGFAAQDLPTILGEFSPQDLLRRIEYNVSRSPPGTALRLSPTNRDPNAPRIVSHIISRHLQQIIPRTDLLTNMQLCNLPPQPATPQDMARMDQQHSHNVPNNSVPPNAMNTDMPNTWTPPLPPRIPTSVPIEPHREEELSEHQCEPYHLDTAVSSSQSSPNMYMNVGLPQRYPEQSSPIFPGCIILTEDDDFLSEGNDM